MSKHPPPDRQIVKGPDDLLRNPGIGQSTGLDRREGLEPIEGENTVEGDLGNDLGPNGELLPRSRGRTNP